MVLSTIDASIDAVVLFIVAFKLYTRLSCNVQAVYFYQSDGRGPCLAFEGEKLQLHWYRGYMLVVGKESKPLPRG